jgi:hypothetical protein
MQLFELMLDFETLRKIISRENFEIEQGSLKVRKYVRFAVRPPLLIREKSHVIL